jgi:glycosyltransferase involved in cell wall biosynthesis
MQKSVIVVPCYNEESRLPVDVFLDTPLPAGVSFLFVDDGSTDYTAQVLDQLAEKLGAGNGVLRLQPNRGKAEAVRHGMLAALREGAYYTGYLDADLATPLEELFRLLDLIDSQCKDIAMGSRVRLLGTLIERSAVRHYLGRVFATVASLCLGIPLYDSQCGAKVFRRTEALEAALADRFISRWAFDVELLGRLLAGSPDAPAARLEDFIEMPLQRWHDVRDSKLRVAHFPRIGLDMFRIIIDFSRRKKGGWKAAAPRIAPTPVGHGPHAVFRQTPAATKSAAEKVFSEPAIRSESNGLASALLHTGADRHD